MRAKPLSELDAAAGDARPSGVPAEWQRFRYPQSLLPYVVMLSALGFVAWSCQYLRIDVERLPGLFVRIADVLATRYFPPDVEHVLHAAYLRSVWETLQMSYLATLFGVLLAVPLAWCASFNVTPGRRLAYPCGRLAIMACRSVHEMVWTILLVAVFGFGMLAGTLALTLACVGFCGKLFAEAVESVDPGPLEAMRATGASSLQVFVFGVLPQVRVAWAGITIYTWDVIFRSATVVGFFGAGGMGGFLRESVQRVESNQVAAILLSIIVVVLIAETFSAWARARIARAMA